MSRSFGESVVDDRSPMRDRPVRDLFEPGDHAQRRRLAAARGADEHEELAVLDRRARGPGRRGRRRRRPCRRRFELHVSHSRPPPSSCRPSRRGTWARRPAATASLPSIVAVVAEQALELAHRRARPEAVAPARERRARRDRASSRPRPRVGRRSRRRRRAHSGSRRARARGFGGAARTAFGSASSSSASHVSSCDHGIVRRASSPHSPSRPSSSPANTIGTPGRRHLQADADELPLARARRSCGTSPCRGCRAAPRSGAPLGHGTPARKCRIVFTTALPESRGTRNRQLEELLGAALRPARRRAATPRRAS